MIGLQTRLVPMPLLESQHPYLHNFYVCLLFNIFVALNANRELLLLLLLTDIPVHYTVHARDYTMYKDMWQAWFSD